MKNSGIARIRHLENVHIPLWLFKDTCWMLKFKLAGTLLILPTVGVALLIVWRTRSNRNLFLPNLSVAFWILANSFWMLGEFFGFEYEWASLALFIGGVLSLGCFGWMLFKGKARLQ